MSQATLEIRRISAHAGPIPGAGVKREFEVAKLIDTTTCIGCKACEVACLEWNGLTFQDTTFHNSYQTMPETDWNYWNLIKFDEYEPEGGNLMLLMRKDQCMHCDDPGCLAACPADGAIVQYTNGIVDFQQDHCIGCGYCITGCPFNIPKFNPSTHKVFKCTLCVDRVTEGLEPACIKACPTGCLHFGTKAEMKELGETRALQLREQSGFAKAGVYDPPGVGGTHVLYVLHDASKPEIYGGLPSDPQIPWAVKLWKHPLKWLGNLAMIGGLVGLGVHYLRFGPKVVKEEEEPRPATPPSPPPAPPAPSAPPAAMPPPGSAGSPGAGYPPAGGRP
jgi:formate dehydrogenase iron-sulfur subunit